jgi:hypothetical protein
MKLFFNVELVQLVKLKYLIQIESKSMWFKSTWS